MCVYMGLLKLRDVEMTQKTKLEIIGPYTPEHEGPFCTRDGQAIRLITRSEGHPEFPIVGIVGNDTGALVWDNAGSFFGRGQRDGLDLMNAREVPVAREFWLVSAYVFPDEIDARRFHTNDMPRSEIIHVREVLPGEGE